MKSAVSAIGVVLFAAGRCATLDAPAEAARLVIRSPDLTRPLSEAYPSAAVPEDPVKKAVFDRINADRAAEGLKAVAWDEKASRVADLFTSAQVREGTRGHFLLDGLPPYARMGLAGVFGLDAENSVAWTTTGGSFHESPVGLALDGQASMLAEKPPNDGHRRTILDPDATHVGIGWAQGGGSFRMAEEFMTRHLSELTLERVATEPSTVLFRGKTVLGQRLEFVTFANEPMPQRLSRAQANARSRYGYPAPRQAYVAEGLKSLHIVGLATEDRIRVAPGGDFSFRFTPGLTGLWTIVFHTSDGRDKPRPGGLAVLRVEAAKAP